MNERLLTKLGEAWKVSQHLSLGQLIESIDNLVWEMVPTRHTSARMMHVSNELFEQALDQWIHMPAVRQQIKLK